MSQQTICDHCKKPIGNQKDKVGVLIQLTGAAALGLPYAAKSNRRDFHKTCVEVFCPGAFDLKEESEPDTLHEMLDKFLEKCSENIQENAEP